MQMSYSAWSRRLAWVERALDLPTVDRTASIARLGVPECDRQCVRDLLADHAALRTNGFLGDLTGWPGSPLELPGRLVAGELVGPWRLLREIGEGGMGSVWLAERADEQMARTVAIKLPHAGPGQEILARRLLRERDILAGLEHAHIARLYEVGLTDAGMPYLAMEYVEGDSLTTHADGNRLGVKGRLDLFVQVLSAVQYAHGKLVLHRDLKPANILVGADGEVKLLDFGIARLLGGDDAAGPQRSELTHGTGRALTPGYASPEQLQGRPLGTASDVYALGVVLYELLCGRRPHAELEPSAARWEAAVCTESPRPPSRQRASPADLQARATTTRALARALHGDLDAIVLKALEPDPERRYASPALFAADLARLQAGRPVSVHAPGMGYRVRKFVARHRWGTAIGAAGAAALVALAGVAATQEMQAHQEALRAATARDFLLDLFAQAAPDPLGDVPLNASQWLERGRQQAQARLNREPRLQAELLTGIGDTLLQMQQRPQGDAALARAADLFRALHDPKREAAARMLRMKGAFYDGRFDVLEDREGELQALVPTIAGDRLLALEWLLVRGLRTAGAGGEARSRALLAQCIRQADASNPHEAAISFEARLLLTRRFAATGQFDAAGAQLLAAGQMREAEGAQERAVRRVELDVARAETALLADHYVDVRQWLPASIRRCEAQFGASALRCGPLKMRLLWALLRLGESAEAMRRLPQLSQNLDRSSARSEQFASAYLEERILAVNGLTDRSLQPMQLLERFARSDVLDPATIEYRLPALYSLIELRLRGGELEKAERWLARAEEVASKAPAREMVSELRRFGLARGLVLQARGRHREALQSMGYFCESPQTDALGSMLSLDCVDSLVALGQQQRAREIARTALTVVQRSLGPDAPNTGRVKRRLQELEASTTPAPHAWAASRFFMS
jgi:hypothetical protein